MSTLNFILFSIYPYIAFVIFILGSILRYDHDAYGWGTKSSQLIQPKTLRIGSNLFHVGILGLFFGHFVGLLTPASVWHFLGISTQTKQWIAIISGGTLGIITLIGLVLLIARRMTSPNLHKVTTTMDRVLYTLILLTLLFGLCTLPLSIQHSDGQEMLRLMAWAQNIVTLGADSSQYLIGASWVFKLHMLLGMTLFLLFPFTRLVHVWSGFATILYLLRPWQIVRGR